MSCAIDAVAWGEQHRVQLATGKRQVWVLGRTSRDAPTQDSIPATTKAVMVKWFAGTPLDTQFADAGDAVDGIEVLAVSHERPAAPSGAQRREDLDPVPVLASGASPPLFVTVAFNYRGYAKSLPWPVWTASSSILRADKLCPLDCDWMLVWATPAALLDEAPEEESLLDKLVQHGGGPLASAAQLVQLAGYGLAVYLGWQALSVILPTLRPLRRRSS